MPQTQPRKHTKHKKKRMPHFLILQPEFQLFDTAMRQWMGTAQISICIVFLVIYFSILSLQQIIELRQNAKSNRIMRCMGKSDKQIARLVNQQIAIKLSSPMRFEI